MQLRTVLGLTLLAALGACSRLVPPASPSPREAREVRAAFEPTWDAVMDVFAQEVIPIDVLEKASGFVAAETAVISDMTPSDSARARAMADCGRRTGSWFANELVFLPSNARYNVLVRSSGPQSTVRVTVRFLRVVWGGGRFITLECSSKGAFEAEFEQQVRRIAERTAAR